MSIVGVSVLALLATTFQGVRAGRALSEELNEQQLVGLRTTGALGIVDYMAGLERTANTVASSPQTVAVIELFSEALDDLNQQGVGDRDQLVSRYRTEFLGPFSEAGIELDTRDIVSDRAAAIYLQSIYHADLGAGDLAMSIDDAQDGTEWSAIHAAVHPAYRELVQRRELIDVLLVEPVQANVVYSVAKRPDLGTSLRLGPFSGSLVAGAVEQAFANASTSAVLADFSLYPPAGLTPVGAIARPVIVDELVVGVVVLIFDSSELTNILTAEHQWDRAGYPATGDTFLISGDGTLRSDRRAFIENPTAFVAANSVDEEADTRSRRIEAAGTSVLVHRVDPQTVRAAQEGEGGADQQVVSSDVTVLRSVGPVEVAGVQWFVVAEVSGDVADRALDEFQNVLIIGAAVFVVGLAFGAVAWSRNMLRPVREMSDRLGEGVGEYEPVMIPDRSPIEFHRLISSYEAMAEALNTRRDRLGVAQEEYLDLLHQVLPRAAAERAANGGSEDFEVIAHATVVVVVVRGLGARVSNGHDAQGPGFVDELFGHLDEIAGMHGVERIKIVGDAYFAACGHDQPYIDHAPRCVAFATDVREAIEDLGRTSGAGVGSESDRLGSSSGIHSDSLTVGTGAGNRILYDAWGPAVSIAYRLARTGSRSQILTSSASVDLLPDTTTRRPVRTNSGATSNSSTGGSSAGGTLASGGPTGSGSTSSSSAGSGSTGGSSTGDGPIGSSSNEYEIWEVAMASIGVNE